MDFQLHQCQHPHRIVQPPKLVEHLVTVQVGGDVRLCDVRHGACLKKFGTWHYELGDLSRYFATKSLFISACVHLCNQVDNQAQLNNVKNNS